MHRQRLVAIGAVAVCVAASSTPLRAQTAAAPRAAGGELVPFWLVIPAYPQIAQAARVQGVVVVALTVAADGRVQSARIERDVPLLSHDVLACARDSGFICRGCTGPMPYRIEYRFQFADTLEQAEAMRAFITSTSGTLPIAALPRTIDAAASESRPASGRPLEHVGQEP